MSSAIIVEGHDDRRDALVSFFRQLGFDAILSTADAGFALQLIRSGPAPTVVLLDTHEPQMDGVTVLAAIRADPRLANIPVVSIRAEADEPPEGGVQHVSRSHRTGRAQLGVIYEEDDSPDA